LPEQLVRALLAPEPLRQVRRAQKLMPQEQVMLRHLREPPRVLCRRVPDRPAAAL
jgi:hypothetical protein